MTLEMIRQEEKRAGFNAGLEQGIEQGMYQTKLETAKKMLAKNMTFSDISDFTGLPLDEIQKL